MIICLFADQSSSVYAEINIEGNSIYPTDKVEEPRPYVPFQSYSRDHHHEHHWGPYFEEEKYTQVTAHVGAEALLNCRVVMLKDKTVTMKLYL